MARKMQSSRYNSVGPHTFDCATDCATHIEIKIFSYLANTEYITILAGPVSKTFLQPCAICFHFLIIN